MSGSSMRRLGLVAAAVLGCLVGSSEARAHGGGGNGRLPKSSLARIYHPSNKLYLRKDAAAAWNAMRNYIRARGTDIYPAGPISAYRTYSQQVYAKRVYGRNAATPGTSNHGLGLAVDLATRRMRSAIDRYGARFGWAKKWSDASWEWWHLRYRSGVWRGRNPGIGGGGSGSTLEVGDRGARVKQVQRALKAKGYNPGPVDGVYGKQTKSAVKKFQRKKGMKADGVVGPKTKKALGIGAKKKSADKKKKAPAKKKKTAKKASASRTLAQGTSGPQVRALQRALEKSGHDVGAVDGVFGPRTRAAVIAFQKKKKLEVDGIVGPETRRALGI